MIPPSLQSCAAHGARTLTDTCAVNTGNASTSSSSSCTRTTAAKRVSFRERIDEIAEDGTVEYASLKEIHSYDSSAVYHHHSSNPPSCIMGLELGLDFDFGLCRIADVMMTGSFDSCAGEEEDVVQVEERMIVASYKKLAPRSQLQYIKRAARGTI